LLQDHGIKREDEISALERYAMACPALPLCGLATTEAERALPAILDRMTKLLKKVGLGREHFITRMTGCPNGCARPYLAEVGFVGNGPSQYQLWLGASPNQTRLSQVYMEKMHVDDLEDTLEPLFICFKQNRHKNEKFGDFCDRYGMAALQAFAAEYSPAPKRRRAPDHRRRVTVRDDIFDILLNAAAQRNQSMTDVVDEAIKAYLNIDPDSLAKPESDEAQAGSETMPEISNISRSLLPTESNGAESVVTGQRVLY
jgi:sulfite reductase (ferredoxin)